MQLPELRLRPRLLEQPDYSCILRARWKIDHLIRRNAVYSVKTIQITASIHSRWARAQSSAPIVDATHGCCVGNDQTFSIQRYAGDWVPEVTDVLLNHGHSPEVIQLAISRYDDVHNVDHTGWRVTHWQFCRSSTLNLPILDIVNSSCTVVTPRLNLHNMFYVFCLVFPFAINTVTFISIHKIFIFGKRCYFFASQMRQNSCSVDFFLSWNPRFLSPWDDAQLIFYLILESSLCCLKQLSLKTCMAGQDERSNSKFSSFRVCGQQY
jgi:hypothetical protein